MNHVDELTAILAPQGIHTVTTGADEVAAYLAARWGTHDADAVRTGWRAEFDQIETASAIVVGVPCDVGAGFERGSFKGPLALRTAMLHAGLYEHLRAHGIVDIGDVRVNPQLLDDSYYAEELLQSVRRARNAPDGLPVAPLSALSRVLDLLAELAPDAPVLVLGGDHSLSRVPVEALVSRGNADSDLGILHFDAHTDLLGRRDGVPHNFATWAFHANEAIGRGGRLVQVGVRVSGRSREEWESSLDLRQMRMDQIVGRSVTDVAEEICACLDLAGVDRVYISNDIDGTDPTFAAATGTMEPGGLHPDLVCGVIAAVAAEFDVVGSDLVEVAPPLKWHIPGEPARTIRTGCRYIVEQLRAMTGAELDNPFVDIVPADAADVARIPPYV